MAGRWQQRPEGSTWGDFGEDDQLGRLNLVTREKVLEGLREVREGRTFCLSLPLDYPGGAVLNPRRKPPRLAPTVFPDGCACVNFPLLRVDGRNTDVLCDDEVTLALQYSTQWDSFAHVGSFFDADDDGVAEKVYYNGFRADEHVVGPADYGARALHIANFAVHGIQDRAVLLDLRRHFGIERRIVGHDDLQRVIAADGVDVRRGDLVLLRTGFAEELVAMNRSPDLERLEATGCVLDGRDPALLQWITDSGVAALCADNYAVEAYPAREALGRRPALPLHQHCLFKLGVPLGELWWLKDLAEHLARERRTAFLLTAPPLRLPGAVGSPVTPVATV
ncbi:MAG TPA: cyclase family protein [Ramlibacter sp.]|nr:cyclase family protein [Ramlibacter sp.]